MTMSVASARSLIARRFDQKCAGRLSLNSSGAAQGRPARRRSRLRPPTKSSRASIPAARRARQESSATAPAPVHLFAETTRPTRIARA